MSLSVRMDPLLGMQLEQAARRQGMTKTDASRAALKSRLSARHRDGGARS
jgi:hypothetical protein